MTIDSRRPIRVAKVLGKLDIGGVERRILELIPRLNEYGVEIHFIAISGVAGELAGEAIGLGAHVHPLALNWAFPVRFVRLIRRIGAPVVHSDVNTFSGVLVTLGRIAGCPVRIVHFRSDGDGQPDTLRRRVQRGFMKWLIARSATHILGGGPSSLATGYSARWRADPRCGLLPIGIDLDWMARSGALEVRSQIGIPPSDVVCLHVGRPAPEKRRWLIPAMIAALCGDGVAAHAVYAGPRGEKDDARVMSAAGRAGVPDRNHLIGSVREVGHLMRQADVLLLPSDREGVPGVVLEALSAGTPVVASDLSGVRFIAERLSGVWVVPADAGPARWAETIKAATSRRPTAASRAAAAAEFAASSFSLESSATAHARIYRAV